MRDFQEDTWFEPSHFGRHKDSYTENLEQRLDLASEFLEEVVKQLYTTKPLDSGNLEWNLDELCHYLGVKIEKGDMQIQRKENNWLVGYTQELNRLSK